MNSPSELGSTNVRLSRQTGQSRIRPADPFGPAALALSETSRAAFSLASIRSRNWSRTGAKILGGLSWNLRTLFGRLSGLNQCAIARLPMQG